MIKVGDVVRHFLGGPHMTVVTVTQRNVETVWFDSNRQFHRDSFISSELVFLWH